MLTGGLDPPDPLLPDEHSSAAPAARPFDAPIDAAWRVGGQVCRVVVPVCVVAVALVGALAYPRLTVMTAPALAVLAGGVVALVDPDPRAQYPSRRSAVLAAVSGALVVPFVSGIEALGSAGAVVALVLLVLTCVLIASVVVGAGGPALTDSDLARLRQAVPALPGPALVDEWSATDRALRTVTDPAQRRRAVEFRALLLDELVRRYPAGVDAWLHDPGSRLGAHIRSEEEREE